MNEVALAELDLGWPSVKPTEPAEQAAAPAGEVLPDFAAFPMGGRVVVCTSLDIGQATARLNVEYPGSVGWRLSSARVFPRGGAHPGWCEEASGTHRHLLFETDTTAAPVIANVDQ